MSWYRRAGQSLSVFLLCIAISAMTAGVTRQALAASPEYVTVHTAAGTVRGKVSGDDAVDLFKGIPYALPPVGELRWRAPSPIAPWSGVRDAFDPGSPCPQSGRLASTNEDCLYLNVWRPHRRLSHDLPVMVFIHGGGQRTSAAHEYNADWLVTRGEPVIFVSINYRLNIFAFLAHRELTAAEPQLGSGNYALLDQMQALRWIRENIKSFGGDPDNVTIFGESGGAQAVCVLLAAPQARGLFHRAISQSGPCQWQLYPSLRASEDKGAELALQFGCTQPNPMPCLRALPTTMILGKEQGATSDTASAQPSWGGGAFPLPMREAIASGRFTRVPLMQGSNRDEAMFQLALQYGGSRDAVRAEQYRAVLSKYFGDSRVSAIEAQYPLADYPAPIYVLSAVLSDSGMVTNNRIGMCNLHLANQLAAPHVSLYAYEFADRTAPYPAPIFNAPGNLIAAAHTTELSYLFHQRELTTAQRTISDLMIRYWTNFARKGDPNGEGLPNWSAYQTDKQAVMRFESNNVSENLDFFTRYKCKFWAEQGFGTLSGPYPRSTASGPNYE